MSQSRTNRRGNIKSRRSIVRKGGKRSRTTKKGRNSRKNTKRGRKNSRRKIKGGWGMRETFTSTFREKDEDVKQSLF